MNKFTLIKYDKHGMKQYSLDDKRIKWSLIGGSVLTAALMITIGVAIGSALKFDGSTDSARILELQSMIDESQRELVNHRNKVQTDIDSITLQIGKLMAQSTRLNALGTRLTDAAGIDSGEFDFTAEPGVGGSYLELAGENNTPEEVFKNLFSLENTLQQQADQLQMISHILNEKELVKRSTPNNMPLENGWISSRYGNRIDPFTGKKSKHLAIDFSGKYNAEIYAAADGIVTWAGRRSTYGNLVEIDHGNGFITRYAHAKSIDVKVGQKVTSGEKIAIMGKTGRATSEHLHFEVFQNGRKVNPLPFIKAS